MPSPKLTIISSDPSAARRKSNVKPQTSERKNYFERQWQQNPQQFNPDRNAIEKERIRRTWQLISPHAQKGVSAVDLGCGFGVLARKLRDAGSKVVALDISKSALNCLAEESDIAFIEDTLPRTRLPDEAFDLVVCTDVIADLDPKDYRLFFSELARLLKSTGHLICSTPIDYRTEEAPSRFLALAATEFEIIETLCSFHAITLLVHRCLSWPEKSLCAAKNPILRKMWSLMSFIMKPLDHFIVNNEKVISFFEWVTRHVKGKNGISHMIFAGRRKQL